MKRTFAVTMLAAAVVAAQGPRGPQQGASPSRPASSLNMASPQTLTGRVDAVDIGFGTEYPSISVNKTLIKIAPAWYLLQKNFEIKAGDTLTVTAAPSLKADDSYLYAIALENAAARTGVVLRDPAGIPLWSGPGAGRGNPGGAPHNGAGCVDAAAIATASGTIDKLSAGAGIQHPSMVLKTADGRLLSVELGPERLLLETDLELKVGQPVSVRYALESCTGELVALSITDSAGVTVVLRNDDGSPNWN